MATRPESDAHHKQGACRQTTDASIIGARPALGRRRILCCMDGGIRAPWTGVAEVWSFRLHFVRRDRFGRHDVLAIFVEEGFNNIIPTS